FFFQAEDGIRDATVTGVQTCALPISSSFGSRRSGAGACDARRGRKAGRQRLENLKPADRVRAVDSKSHAGRTGHTPLCAPAPRQIGRASCRGRQEREMDTGLESKKKR